MNIKKIKLIFNLTLTIFTLALPLSKISAMKKQEKKLNEILDNEETKYREESSENTSNDKIDSQYYKNQNEEYKNSLNEIIKSIEDIFNNQNKITEDDKKTLDELIKESEDTLNSLKTTTDEWYNLIDKQNEIIKSIENIFKNQNKITEYDKKTLDELIKESEDTLNNLKTTTDEWYNLIDKQSEIIKSIENIFKNQNKITEDDKKTLDKLIGKSENTLNNLKTKTDEWYNLIDKQKILYDKYLEDYKEYQKKLKLSKFRIKGYEIEKYKNYLNNVEKRLNTKNILDENQSSLNTLLNEEYKNSLNKIIKSIEDIFNNQNKITEDDKKTLDELIKESEDTLNNLKTTTDEWYNLIDKQNETIKSIENIFNNQNKITEDDKKTLDKLIGKSEDTLNNLKTKTDEWYNLIDEQKILCDEYIEDYKEYQKKLKLYKFRIKEYEIEKYKNHLNIIESNIKERLNSKNILNDNQSSLNTLLKEYGETLLKLETTVKEKELDDYIKECNNSMDFYEIYDDYYYDPEIIDEDICVEILNKYKDYNKYIEDCNKNFKNYNNDIKKIYKQILKNNTNEISKKNKIKLKQEYENILSTLDKEKIKNSKKIFDEIIINSIETILNKKTNKITKNDEKALDELIKEYEKKLSKLEKNTTENDKETIAIYKKNLEKYKIKIKKNYMNILDETINSIEKILNKKTNEITKNDEKALDELIEEYNETLSKLEEKITEEDDKETIENYKENLKEYKIKIKENYINILDETINSIEKILNKKTNEITKDDEKTLDELIEEYEKKLSKLEKNTTKEDNIKTITKYYKENLEKINKKILDEIGNSIENILSKKISINTNDDKIDLNILIEKYKKKLSILKKNTTKNNKETIKNYENNLKEYKIKSEEKKNKQILYETANLIEKILSNATNGIQQAEKITLDNLIKKCEEILSKLEKNTTENNKENIEIFKDNLKDYKNKNNEIKILPHEKILEDIINSNYSIVEEYKKIGKIPEKDINNLVISTRIFNDTFKELENTIICEESKENMCSKENLEKYENIIEKIYIKPLDEVTNINSYVMNCKKLCEITKENLNHFIVLTKNFNNILNKFKVILDMLDSLEIYNKNKENIKNYEENLTKYKNKIIDTYEEMLHNKKINIILEGKQIDLNNLENTITSEEDRKTLNELIKILSKLKRNTNKNYEKNLDNQEQIVILKEDKDILNELLNILTELNEDTAKDYEEILNKKYRQTLNKFKKEYGKKFNKQNENIHKSDEEFSSNISSNIKECEETLEKNIDSIDNIFEKNKNKIISKEDLENLDKLIRNFKTTLTHLKRINNSNKEYYVYKYENIIANFKTKYSYVNTEFKIETKKSEYRKSFNKIKKEIKDILDNDFTESETFFRKEILPKKLIKQSEELIKQSEELIEKYEITLNALKKDTDINSIETVNFYEQNLKEIKKSTAIKLLEMIIKKVSIILNNSLYKILQEDIYILDNLLKKYEEIFTGEVFYELGENNDATKRYKMYLTSMKKQIYTRKLKIKITDLNKFNLYYENTIKNIKIFKSYFKPDNLKKWDEEIQQFECFISILKENADQTDKDFINECNNILEDNKNKIAEIREIKKQNM